MKLRPPNFRPYYLPLSTAVIVAALVGLYLLVWVPRNLEYLTQRNLRILGVMSDQVRAQIESFGTILSNIAKDASRVPVESRVDRIKEKLKLVPKLSVVDTPEVRHLPDDGGGKLDSMSLHVVFEKQKFSVHFDYRGRFPSQIPDSSWYSVHIHARSRMRDLVQSIVRRDEFDDILIVARTGRQRGSHKVVFQRDPGELRITDLDTLRDRHGGLLTLSDLVDRTQVHTVRLIGEDYKLFAQPSPIALRDGNGDDDPNSEKWLLLGLVRAQRLHAESRSVPHGYLVVLMFGVVAVILGIPILKIRFIGARDRLQFGDVVLFGLSLVILAGFVTILGLDLHSYLKLSGKLNEELEKFSHLIESHLEEEIDSASDMLAQLNDSLANRMDEFLLPDNVERPNIFKRADATETDILSEYPYFEMIFWADRCGKQVAKWSIREATTPLIEVQDRPYFQNVLKKRLWRHPDSGRRFVLQSIYSWTTGQNQVILAAPFAEQDPAASSGHSINGKTISILEGAVVSRFMSVIEPVIPAGFGFAIVDQRGQVLFHADSRRNLRENFFAECGQDGDLLASVVGRVKQSMNLRYLGSDHHVLVRPLEAFPDWTLVAFRDKEILGTLNVELLTTALVPFLVCLLEVALLVMMLWLFGSPRDRLRRRGWWLWPDPERKNHYLALILMLSLLMAAAVVGFFNLSRETNFYLAFLWPALSVVILFAVFRKHCPLSAPVPKWWHERPDVPLSYITVWFLAVILIAVLPALIFFRLAHNLEAEILIKHGQRSVASGLEARRDALEDDYRKVALNDSLTGFLEKRLTFQDTLDIYTSFFSNTTVDVRPGDSCAASSDVEGPHGLEDRLAAMMLLHNPITIEVRGLVHDASEDRRWVWQHAEDDRLVLHKRDYWQGQCLEISSVLPDLGILGNEDGKWLPLIPLGLAGLLGPGLFVLLVYTARRLFLTDLLNANPLAAADATESTLWLQIPAQRRAQLKEDIGFHFIDLAKRQPGGAEGWSFDNDELPEAKTIVLDHFDHDRGDPVLNTQKLVLLERLLHVHQRRVIILSHIHPWHFAVAEEMLERWRAVLKGLQRVFTLDPGNAEAFERRVMGCRSELAPALKRHERRRLSRLCDLVMSECRSAAQLQRIGESLLNEPSLPYLTDEQLVRLIRERAGAFYNTLWLACSSEERFVLLDIAYDGFVNYENETTVMRLMRSGLVVRQPEVRIFNESFRRFVLEERQILEALRWQKKGATSAWQRMRAPLILGLVGVLVFVFSTQPDVFKSTLSIVSAITAGIPALVKLISSLRFEASQAPKE